MTPGSLSPNTCAQGSPPNRMKVTLVTPYWAPVRGGTTTYVQELAAELRRTYGLDVTVIAREGRGEARVTVVGGTASQFIRRAATELERLRPNVVHAQGHWYALEAGIRYRRNHPGTLVVFTLHTPFPPRSWWRRYALKFVLSKADFVTGVSAAILGTTIRAFGFRTRTRVTHPGVSLVPASAQSVAEFLNTSRLAVRGPIVGYLGRLVWDEKVRGVAHLIRAMKMVRMSFPSATLVVAGDGPHRTALEELAAREAAGCVVFLGDVEDPVPRFYDALDLYAHISFQEGLRLAGSRRLYGAARTASWSPKICRSCPRESSSCSLRPTSRPDLPRTHWPTWRRALHGRTQPNGFSRCTVFRRVIGSRLRSTSSETTKRLQGASAEWKKRCRRFLRFSRDTGCGRLSSPRRTCATGSRTH